MTEENNLGHPVYEKMKEIVFGICEQDNSKGTPCSDCLAIVQQVLAEGNLETAVLLAQAAMMRHVCVESKKGLG